MPHFFISYRRMDQEGRYLAHMVFRELRGRYGEHSVFLDVDSLSPGLSFPVKVGRALDRTDVVLVIIGPAWMRLLNERPPDATDWVRYEVAQSLARPSLPVVPVCCAGVQIPLVTELPDDLKDLGWRDGITLDPFQDFDSHLHRFLVNVERVLEELREEQEELRALRAQLAMLIARRREQALAPLLATLVARVARLHSAASPPRIPAAVPRRVPETVPARAQATFPPRMRTVVSPTDAVTAPPSAPAAAQHAITGAPVRQAGKRKDRASPPWQPPPPHKDAPVPAEYVTNIRKFADEARQNTRNGQIYAWVAAVMVSMGAGMHVVGLLAGGAVLLVGYFALWITARAHAQKLRTMIHAKDLTPAQRVDLARRLKDVKSPVLKRIISEL